MKAIALLLASTQAVKLSWPSVARCAPGQVSTDSSPCDHNNNGVHPLDGTTLQLTEQWPSVARCAPGQVSTDSAPCDHNNNGVHPLDGTTVQLTEELNFRPPIKCVDPGTGNPISCDHDDINELNNEPLPKVGGWWKGLTPVKVIKGGPTINMDQQMEMIRSAEKEKEAKMAEEAK